MCIAGYLLSVLGIVFLLLGVEYLRGKVNVPDEEKAKKTNTIIRIIAFPVFIVGTYFFLTAAKDLSDTGRVIILIGSLIMAVPAILTLITGRDVFAMLDKQGRGVADDIHDPTQGTVRKLGLIYLLISVLILIRALLFNWF